RRRPDGRRRPERRHRRQPLPRADRGPHAVRRGVRYASCAAGGEVSTLAGRVAIGTGAANGLGRAIAEALHRAGASLALVDVDADGLARAAGELRAEGAEVEPIAADLADANQVRTIP